MTVMIDTLKFARNFETAGFAKLQAEALTSALAEMKSESREDLVTKTDLQLASAAGKADLHLASATGKADLQVAVAQLKSEITTTVGTAKWQILWMMFGSQLFVIAAVAAVVNFSKLFG